MTCLCGRALAGFRSFVSTEALQKNVRFESWLRNLLVNVDAIIFRQAASHTADHRVILGTV